MVYYDNLYGGVLEGDGNNGSGGGAEYSFDEDDFNVVAEGTEPPAGLTYIPNRFFGKTLVCCGDSITNGAAMPAAGITNNSDIPMFQRPADAGAFVQKTTGIAMTYGWQIAHRNHMTFYDDGINSSTLLNYNQYSFSRNRYNTLPDSIDYMTILFGSNDEALGTLGTISDSTSATYYGAWNVVLPYLIDKYPTTKIGLIVPFGVPAEWREAVRLVGNKWGLAVLDMYQGGTPLFFEKEPSVGVEESIVTANRATYMADIIHPNYKGHTFLADIIENWLYSL